MMVIYTTITVQKSTWRVPAVVENMSSAGPLELVFQKPGFDRSFPVMPADPHNTVIGSGRLVGAEGCRSVKIF